MKRFARRSPALLAGLAGLALPLFPAGAWAEKVFGESDDFAQARIVSDKELATMRGGFIRMNGMRINFSLATEIRVNNETKLQTIFSTVNGSIAKAHASLPDNNSAKTLTASAEVTRIASQVTSATQAALGSPKATEAFLEDNATDGTQAQQAAISALEDTAPIVATDAPGQAVVASAPIVATDAAGQAVVADAPTVAADTAGQAAVMEQLADNAAQSVSEMNQLQDLLNVAVQNSQDNMHLEVARVIDLHVSGANDIALAAAQMHSLQALSVDALR